MVPKIFLIAFIAIIVLGGAGYIGYQQLKSKPSTPSVTPLQPSPTPIPEELTTWTDQSEFTFQYPKSLALNPHDEDQINYAQVELTSASHSGSLIVWAKDAPTTTLEDWAKTENISGAIDTTLASMSAKKVLTSSDPKKIITTIIRNGYLYQIETSVVDNEYWNRVNDTVTSTFAFPVADKLSPDQSATDETASEEIIE